MEYVCQCCNKNQGSVANLNKHLFSCSYYDEWLKNYKPPSITLCKTCERNFIDITKHICDNIK